MKPFLVKISIFISIIFISIVLMTLFINMTINKKVSYRLDKEPRYIALGNSRPQCAFNDSLINDFSNLGQFAETYFFTSIKAKKIIEKNENIEVIFIQIDHNQIGEKIDDWIFSDKNLQYRYWRYFSFMSIVNHQLVFKKNPAGFLNAPFSVIKENGMNIVKNDFNYLNKLGGYEHNIYNNIDPFLLNDEINLEQQTKLAKINIEYLKKLVKYCQNKNKLIYFIRCPLHNKYLGNSDENILKDILASEFKDIEFLDFSKFPLENTDYIDLTHLNYKGARKFSIWFNELINDGILNHSNKQEIINERIDFLYE